MSAPSAPERALHPALLVLAVFSLLALTRLPQLLSPHLALDGDEAIVGLMARHLVAGGSIPVFFYGQSYGLATLEVVSVAGMFSLLGPSALAIKLGSLLVFGLGVLALAAAVDTWRGTRAAWIVAGICIAMPAWATVSMRGWGINLSAWTLTHLGLWIAARLDCGRTRAVAREALLLGVVLGLLSFTQPLALVGLAPFIAASALQRNRARRPLFAMGGFAAVVALLAILSFRTEAYWAPAIFSNLDPVAALRALPDRVWVATSGVYRLGESLPMGAGIARSVALWVTLYCGALAHAIWRIARSDRDTRLLVCCLAGIALTVASSLFINPEYFGFRYLLWPTTYFALLAGLALDREWGKSGPARIAATAVAVVLAVVSSVSFVELGRVSDRGYTLQESEPESRALGSLVGRLREEGVRHVYSTDPMFQWVLMFASGEEVRSRWAMASDRVAAYPAAVDRALRAGEPVALVAPAHHRQTLLALHSRRGAGDSTLESIGERYVLWLGPTELDLRRLGFEFD